MSEAPVSAGQERVVEHHQEAMATAAVAQEMERSFLPLKRKPLPHSDEELSEYHRSKRFVSEELMAAHLQHLKLSSEGSAWSSAPHHHTPIPCEGGSLAPYSCHLNIKTVASCPKSVDSQVSRKRQFPELDEEGMGMDISDGETDMCTLPATKRTRTDLDSAAERHVLKCTNFKSDSKVVQASARPEHQRDGGLALSSMSDLTSIPEEWELTQQTSTSIDTANTSNSNASATDARNSSIDTADADEYISVSQSIPTSLPSPQSLHLPLESSELGGKVCSVWLAPELKAIKTHADFPLPLSILKEIDDKSKNRGMEIVPWVGGLHTLFKEDAQEEKGSI